jgi:transglutaminase superfamily protein
VRSWQRLRELSAPELRLLLAASALLPAMALRLRVEGLSRLRSRVERVSGGRDALSIDRVARLVDIAARHSPVRVGCLPRALALQWLLRRRGIEADLRLGVRKEGDRLDAHAWVEHAGTPLMEAPGVAQRFAPFDPLAKAGSR